MVEALEVPIKLEIATTTEEQLCGTIINLPR